MQLKQAQQFIRAATFSVLLAAPAITAYGWDTCPFIEPPPISGRIETMPDGEVRLITTSVAHVTARRVDDGRTFGSDLNVVYVDGCATYDAWLSISDMPTGTWEFFDRSPDDPQAVRFGSYAYDRKPIIDAASVDRRGEGAGDTATIQITYHHPAAPFPITWVTHELLDAEQRAVSGTLTRHVGPSQGGTVKYLIADRGAIPAEAKFVRYVV